MLAADSLGTDFWLAFMQNYTGNPTLSLFITGNTNTSGTVTIPGLSYSVPFSVTANTVTTVSIPTTATIITSDVVEDKGIHVTALAEVSVYGLNQNTPTTDAFLGLPTDILGKDYINLGFTNLNSATTYIGSEFAAVASVNNTTVTITPTATTNGHSAGVPYTVLLNQGQTYQLKNTTLGADLSGTIVTADQPIALFGGHRCANIPTGGTAGGDHLAEQLPPTTTWGKNFVTMPLASRFLGDTFRMLASTDGTQVSVNGTVVATLNRGQFWQQLITGPSQISANNPILVAQYSNGTTFDGVVSDPFMMLIPPQEQFLGDYTVTNPATGFPINYINVVVPTAAIGAITLDGVAIPAASFVPIGSSVFSGAQLAVSAGSHNLSGQQAFGVFVYGFASYNSYGYPGGLSLAPIALVASLNLTPPTVTQSVGNPVTLTATVLDTFNNPSVGVRVDFAVLGSNPKAGFAFTDASGQAVFTYTGTIAGMDTVQASVGSVADTSQITWSTGITITPTTLNLAEGGPGQSYTVGLLSQPTTTVTITVTHDNQVNVSSSILTFNSANWNTPQAVTVTAVDDNVVEGLHTGNITHTVSSVDTSYDKITIPGVTANITDNDFPGVIITQTAGSTTVIKGRINDTYTIALKSQPSADVTINLSGSQVNLAPTTLTFTDADWDQPQTVTVAVAATGSFTGSSSDTITHTSTSSDSRYNNIPITDVPVTILDKEGYIITGTPNNDIIRVTPSTDLSNLLVTVNGQVTFVPATVSQLVIDAGNGNDTIQINNAIIPVFVDAGLGTDILTINGQTSAANDFLMGSLTLAANGNTISLVGLESLTVNGFGSNDTFNVQSNPDPSLKNIAFNGGLGSDSLTGPDTANAWKITGSNAGLLNNVIKFAAIENLTGGSGNDTFSFTAGKNITGRIDGAAGTDVLDDSLFTTPLTFNLQTGSATATGGIQNIETILAGKSTSDKLIGPDGTQAWNITAKNAGNVNGTFFQNIENLTGGSGDDTFTFADAASLTGKIDGGAGTGDTLDYSAYSTAISFNLQTKKATAITGGFANIEGATGGSATNTLTAANKTNTWNIATANAGTFADGTTTFTFAGFGNLVGGSSSDTFNLTASLTGTLNGGLGTDTLVAAGTGSHTWAITALNAGTLDGQPFTAIENLRGGTGADLFTFSARSSLSGKIDGGLGSNTLDYSALTTAVSINLATGKATATAGILNLDQFLAGSNLNNFLYAPNLSNAWNLTATNAGNFTNLVGTYNFTGFQNLTGGTLDDAFTLALADAWTGYLQGGLGSDSLTAFGTTNTWTPSTLNGHKFGSIENTQ